MIGKTRQPHASGLAGRPRGVLVPQFASGRFEHKRGAPSAQLAQLVEHYWYVSWDMQGNQPQTQETLPHPNVHLVVEAEDAGIFGVHTARYTRLLEGRGYAFGIKFRPAGFQPFLAHPLATIAGSCLAPDAVFGPAGKAYVSEIRSIAAAPDAMMAAAEAFLLARIPAADEQLLRANALVAAIATDPELRTVDALAAQSGLNKRSLQRLFQHYVGVGPKWVIKRYRMHEAVAQLQSGAAGAPLSLAALALDLGYFDQAHFIRDFTALVGKPPGEYAKQLPLRT